MAHIAILFGILLSILGVVLFGISGPENPTALIPTFFGVVLIILGIVARNEKARKHAMHGAALLGLLGLLMPGYRVVRALLAHTDWNLALTGQTIMAALCGVFLIMCIRSFIAIRRARQGKEGV